MRKTNIVELFTDYIDSIYWHGYAEELSTSDRETYDFELKQFTYNYNLKP